MVPGLGVKDTPESLEVEIIDLTGPAPSTAPPRPVRSTPLSLTLPPPHRSLKLAVDAPSFSARGLVSTSHTQACAVETETVDRSHPEEVSLIRKHSLVSTPLPPSPGVTPLKDSLCRQAATPKAPPRASPPSQPATTVTQVVSQARSSKIFRPAGLLPSSFYLAVPEPYKTSLEILITVSLSSSLSRCVVKQEHPQTTLVLVRQLYSYRLADGLSVFRWGLHHDG